jgi:histidine ammonia-lyase
VVKKAIKKGKPVYGINTGFGKLCQKIIPYSQLLKLQENLIESHACGVGELLSLQETKLLTFLRIVSLAKGYSGVSQGLIQALVGLFNKDVFPAVPEKGSVGASGDLAQLAHLGLCLMGQGEAFYRSEKMEASEALKGAGLKPYRFLEKEALSLINGTQYSGAVLGTVLIKLNNVLKVADITGATTFEALKCSLKPFDVRLQEVRRYPGQVAVAQNFRKLLSRSQVIESHKYCPKVQDPYSIRCIPQVHGAVRQCYEFAKGIFMREVNSAVDNPLVLGNQIISGGNFHGQPLALAADSLSTALVSLINISERRIAQLNNPDTSGLPAFLVKQSGLNCGAMGLEILAASLASESRALSFPSSVANIPTGAGKEDFVSMSAHSVRKLRAIFENLTYILAIELFCACQGLDFLSPLKPGKGVYRAYRLIREYVKPLERDRILTEDIRKIKDIILSGQLVEKVEQVVGRII